MRYRRFELLVLTVGTAAIFGSAFISSTGAPIVQEVIAQLMLLGVLFAAVHWGRNGGFAAATIASLAYILLRIPVVLQAEGLTGDIATLLLIRVFTFGLVGIVGGELCARIKYIFSGLEASNSIDEDSRIYNQRGMVRALQTACGQHTRYETPCTVILITLDPRLTAELRASKRRAIVRSIASHVRNDIRLVDEAGRLDDGRFAILLPHTNADGGAIVAERLHAGLIDLVGAKDESLTVQALSAPPQFDRIAELTQQLASTLPVVEPQTGLSSS